jgi:hypothetical protein
MGLRDGFERWIRGIVGNCFEGWLRLDGRMRGIFPRDGLEGQIRRMDQRKDWRDVLKG